MKKRTVIPTPAERAVAYALAQRGHKYKWLGSGPDFDCSGLTMMAWEQGGIALPHQSGAQAALLHAVPYTKANKSKLVPGDLVFYYGDVDHPESIAHVAIYTRPILGVKQVVAAVDSIRGVIEHPMFTYLAPSGFGYVNHT